MSAAPLHPAPPRCNSVHSSAFPRYAAQHGISTVREAEHRSEKLTPGSVQGLTAATIGMRVYLWRCKRRSNIEGLANHERVRWLNDIEKANVTDYHINKAYLHNVCVIPGQVL